MNMNELLCSKSMMTCMKETVSAMSVLVQRRISICEVGLNSVIKKTYRMVYTYITAEEAVEQALLESSQLSSQDIEDWEDF